PVELVVDERAYGWKAARQLRRIGLQPRVEEGQVVPVRGVSLLEESGGVRLGAEHGNLHGITPRRSATREHCIPTAGKVQETQFGQLRSLSWSVQNRSI